MAGSPSSFELEAMIFQFVDGVGLERVSMVCKRWRKFISGDEDETLDASIGEVGGVFLRRYPPYVLPYRLNILRCEEVRFEKESKRLAIEWRIGPFRILYLLCAIANSCGSGNSTTITVVRWPLIICLYMRELLIKFF